MPVSSIVEGDLGENESSWDIIAGAFTDPASASLS
jgi:hypothetical protein